MKKTILPLLVIALINIPLVLSAQDRITGRVISADDSGPLPGASVTEKGTTNGVITDLDGNYTIVLSGSPATLVFSYIGMETVERKVTGGGRIDVAMQSEAQQMDETIVVAYGTRKKGTITGSVAAVKAEKMADVPAPSFDQALQGQATGLLVVSNTGEPSEAAEFRIRGNNSINSGMDPLFILDGMQISSSSFNALNPSDIESISVLKDASSTSIYGARAANGVVVITSKRGTDMGKAKVTLRAQGGISQVAYGQWAMMNTAERIQFEKEVGLDSGQDYDLLSQTDIDWMREIYSSHAPLQSYDLSVSAANDRMNYYVSGGYYDQDGIAQGSSFRRYNLRANADVKANKWLKLGTTSAFAYEEYEQADEGEYSIASPISASHFMLPYWSPYKADGSLTSSNDGSWAGTGVNPIEWMDNNPVTYKKYKMFATVYAEINPIENLVIRTQLGIDYSHSTALSQSFPSYAINNGEGAAGRASTDAMNLTSTTTASYSFDVNDEHSFNFMIGQEGVNYHSEGFQLTAVGQTNDLLTDISSATRVSYWDDTESEYSYVSFFARGEYNYCNRYFADFSVREDASSRFGKSSRWGTFWSVGLMWNLRNEPFMQGLVPWLTTAQVSASTGSAGNSDIDNYGHLALVSGGVTYNDEAGIYPSQSKNDDFGWETTQTTNIGIHTGFLNRFYFDAEFYHKYTYNMLMYVP
ncbi:MAG: SusC/RagA family TonB-linked outer membrane protein, partial [Porphyromonadaceae bacterium]|nr:SusC/RagA family TonB-linked outer membrane protein [Porphyromonadaceae bacterium]